MFDTLDYLKNKYKFSFQTPAVVLNGIGRHSGFKEVLKDLDVKVGAEIGTRTGLYAKELCQALPGLKLYCIDPWRVYPGYDEIQDQKIFDEQFRKAANSLKNFNCDLIREESMTAVKRFRPESLDFVFIDGNHEFDFVMDDLREWTKRVKKGGIIFGHDYMPDHPGVIKAVDKYIEDERIFPWFILRVKGQADCFAFVKP